MTEEPDAQALSGTPPGPSPAPPAHAVRRATVLRMLVRSFTVQGSWNYHTLIGTGFAYCLLPVIRDVYRGRPDLIDECVRRHATLFNSHPYLVGVALGGVARLETERQEPALIERFKLALRGSLGTIGDRLVWAGWRPVALLLALLFFLGGAPWWLATGTFLLLYNAGHFAVRVWSLRLGLRYGLRVGERLRSSALGRVQQALPGIGAFLLGAMIPFAATGRFVGMRPAFPWIAAALAGALLGIRFGARLRAPLALLLTGVALLGMILRPGG